MKPDTSTPLRIYPIMCDQQKQDLNTILTGLDDFAASALALANQGPQAYSTFIEDRERFRAIIFGMCDKYRYVE